MEAGFAAIGKTDSYLKYCFKSDIGTEISAFPVDIRDHFVGSLLGLLNIIAKGYHA